MPHNGKMFSMRRDSISVGMSISEMNLKRAALAEQSTTLLLIKVGYFFFYNFSETVDNKMNHSCKIELMYF